MEDFRYFFSYARSDSEFVLKLAKQLRTAGANLWLDQLDILGGQHWDRAVESALTKCQGMIVVLSPQSVESKTVMDEVSFALEEGKLVVPVLFRDCAIPFRLRRVQQIDFTGDYEAGCSQLLRALRIDRLSPGPIPEPTRIVTSKYRALKISGAVVTAAAATFAILATLSDTGVFKVSGGLMVVLVSVASMGSFLMAIGWFR